MSFWPRNWRRAASRLPTLSGPRVTTSWKAGLRLPAPVPGVLEGGDLGGGFLAGAFAEEDVVGGVGVKGRVEVDEVNALVDDVAAEDFQVVPEIEAIGGLVSGGHRSCSVDEVSDLVTSCRRLVTP